MTEQRAKVHRRAIFYLSLFFSVASALECKNGKGGMKVIPDERINDGFCDCPYDSLDETKTEACSGAAVGGWPGIGEQVDQRCVVYCSVCISAVVFLSLHDSNAPRLILSLWAPL